MKRSNAQKEVAGSFISSLDNLFDISHADALEKMKINEDRQFLLLQRQKGRPGCMTGVDKKLFMKEKRSTERKNQELARKRKHEEMVREKKSYNSSTNYQDASESYETEDETIYSNSNI